MLCIPGKVCLSFFEKRDKIIIVQVQILLSGFWFFRRAPTSTRRSRSSSWPKSRSTTRHVSMHAILHYLLYLKGTNNNLFLFRCRAASLWRRTAPSVTCCRWILLGFFLDSIKVPWRYLISLLFFVDAFCVSNFFGKENIFSCPFFITLRLPSAAIGSWTSPCSRRWSATSSFGVRSPWTACCWSPTRWWELSIILPLWTKTCHSKIVFTFNTKVLSFTLFSHFFSFFCFCDTQTNFQKVKSHDLRFLFLKIR